MINPHDPVLLDQGKKVKESHNGENWYVYIAPKAIITTMPFENREERRKMRLGVELSNEINTKALGGEYFDTQEVLDE